MARLMTEDGASNGARQPSSSPRHAASIRIEAVSRQFGQAIALDGINLEIKAGEFFTLLGPSGCGKTTLLRLLAGLEAPDAGTIELGGVSMAAIPAYQRSVNTVFQSYALFPHRNVRGNIAFGLEMRGQNAAAISEKIQAVSALIGIESLLERGVNQLSGGQRQRVALARALVNEPDVLLLDEPLSALDAGLRARLQVDLKRLQQQLGMTFVFVTHDQTEAMVMSDRIAVLEHGRVAQVGTPREIYEQPADHFVAQFMGHDNLLDITARDDHGVETTLGRFDGITASGDQLLLRPEALGINPATDRIGPRFNATVEECFYRGGITEYRLDCAGQRLIVLTTSHHTKQYSPGDTVTVGIDPASVSVLRRRGRDD